MNQLNDSVNLRYPFFGKCYQGKGEEVGQSLIVEGGRVEGGRREGEESEQGVDYLEVLVINRFGDNVYAIKKKRSPHLQLFPRNVKTNHKSASLPWLPETDSVRSPSVSPLNPKKSGSEDILKIFTLKFIGKIPRICTPFPFHPARFHARLMILIIS